MYVAEYRIIGRAYQVVANTLDACVRQVVNDINDWRDSFAELDIRLTPTKWEIHQPATPYHIEASGRVSEDEEIRYI